MQKRPRSGGLLQPVRATIDPLCAGCASVTIAITTTAASYDENYSGCCREYTYSNQCFC